MNGPVQLRTLAMTGSGEPVARIDFGPRLTVVSGASDTGKSFIAKGIDFLLGARELKSVPEGENYRDVFLAVATPERGDLTLGRAATGGPIEIYSGAESFPPSGERIVALGAKHNSKTEANLSRFLLQLVGLDQKLVRTNQAGKSRMLSFRDIAHLVVIDETSIQAETIPIRSEESTRQTVEREVLRLLVEGEEVGLAGSQPADDARQRINKGKKDLLASLVAELQESMLLQESPTAMQDRLDLVNATLSEIGASIETSLDERTRRTAELSTVERDRAAHEAARRDLLDIENRFRLLLAKYESDLDRLDMLAEAGSLLGFFTHGPCPFCGADVDNQVAVEMHLVDESTAFGASVAAERAKTESLRSDLLTTLEDLDAEASSREQLANGAAQEIERVRNRIAAIDQMLEPQRAELEAALSARSSLERQVSLSKQIDSLEARRAQLEEVSSDAVPSGRTVGSDALDGLASTIRSVLVAWGLNDVGSVRIDSKSYDLLVDGRERAGRGKGMRSILHAAFTIGLAEYCLTAGLPHPGFVVLDTPLLTFREPRRGGLRAEADEPVSDTVANAFFRYLAQDFSGQAIVLENVDPPSNLPDETVLVEFTGNLAHGRFGFFPP